MIHQTMIYRDEDTLGTQYYADGNVDPEAISLASHTPQVWLARLEANCSYQRRYDRKHVT